MNREINRELNMFNKISYFLINIIMIYVINLLIGRIVINA